MDDLKQLRQLYDSSITLNKDELGKQRERLANEIAGANPREGFLTRSRRLVGQPRWVVPTLAGALTVAVLAVAAGLFASQPSEQVLLGQPEPDQWIYSSTVGTITTGDDTEEFSTELWLRADFQVSATRGEDDELTTDERATAPLTHYFEDGTDLFDFYQDIVDDPSSALDTIHERLADLEMATEPAMREKHTFDLIRTTLEQGAPPPEAQEALLGVVRELPSVDDDGTVTDAVDREGHAYGKSVINPLTNEPGETRQQLIFAPDGTAFYGSHIDSEPRSRTGAATSSGIVDQPGQVP